MTLLHQSTPLLNHRGRLNGVLNAQAGKSPAWVQLIFHLIFQEDGRRFLSNPGTTDSALVLYNLQEGPLHIASQPLVIQIKQIT